jgi:outer membrane cobalamin receptor
METKTFHIILIFLLFFVASLQAQSMTKIAGFVYSDDGHPLENVNVVVKGTAYGAATDNRGYFEIQNIFSGEYTLTASHIGYEDYIYEHIIVEKDIPAKLTINLRPTIGMLDEIQVSAARDLHRDSAFRISLSSEQINNTSARTLGELLVQIPGVDIIEEGAGGGQKKISIRGSNPNQVLVLLDGIPLNDPLTGETDLNLVPISMVEDVTIHKGGNASKSGSGSMGGQVEIKTKKLLKNEFRVGFNGGSFNARGGNVALSASLGRFSLFSNYDYQTEDGNFPYTYFELDGTQISEDRLNADFKSRQFFIKTGYHADRHQLILQASLYQSDRGLPGTIFFWTPYASANVQRKLAAASYHFTGDQLNLSLQVSAFQNSSEYQNMWPEDPPLKYRRVPPYHTHYQLEAYQADFQSTWRWSESNETIVRLNYRKDRFRDKDLLTNNPAMIQEANNLQAAIGVENNWRFLPENWIDNSSLKLALRYDDVNFENHEQNRNNSHISPKIGIYVGENALWLWSIQANLGRSFRSPTFADLYYQDFRVRGNATLLPEESIDFDIGARIGFPILGTPEFAISYFRQKIENLIVWELGSFATWQPTNKNALIEGMEYEFTWPIWPDHLLIKMNHTDLNARNKSLDHTTHNKLLIYRPENTTRFQIEIKYNRFNLTYQKRIVSERYVTAANTISLPGYHVDDIIIRLSFLTGPINWNLRGMLLNMFDTRYEIVRDAPLPGRHLRAGIEVIY